MSAACIAWTLIAGGARAADPRQASSSRDSRADALAALPLAQLGQQDRLAVEDVVNNASIYRRLPSQAIDCDPHFYLFLLEHPEIVVQVWHVLGISKVTLDRTGEDTFHAGDGEGTVCDVKLLHASHDTHLIFARGNYEGPVLKNRVDARCVLLLRSAYMRETNGRNYVTCKLDAFVRIDQGGLELLARTFQSLIGHSADMNFAEAMGFVSSLSRTAEVNPDGMARIAQRLKGVEPEVRDRLGEISGEVADRSARDEELRRVQHEEALKLEQTPNAPRR